MATNFEVYKDKILEIANKDDDFGVVNGEVGSCVASKCEKCLFRICNGICSTVSKIQWLYAEHIEAPKLTKRERAFCEAVQTGWIARDMDDSVYWYAEFPGKEDNVWSAFTYAKISSMGLNFPFTKWEDAKPWDVEDLLKLDVIEEVQK